MSSERSPTDRLSVVVLLLAGATTISSAVVSYAADSFTLLGVPEAVVQKWGPRIFALSVVLMLFGLLYRLYRRWMADCLRNALRIGCLKVLLRRFQDQHDGTPLTSVVDIRQITLLQRYLRVQHCRWHIREYAEESAPAGAGHGTIKFVVDMPEDAHLVTGMPIAVYARRGGRSLGDAIELNDAHTGGAANASAVLCSRSIRITLPIEPAWNLNIGRLTKRSFRVDLVEPEVSEINELLGLLCHIVDSRKLLDRIALQILAREALPDWISQPDSSS